MATQKIAAPAATVGILIDRLYQQDLAIRKVEKALRDEKAKREEIQNSLLDSMNANKLHGARGRLATAFVSEQKHPKIVSYQKFWGYVVKHQAYDLLQKRVASTAYYDRRENGERVPGVKTFRQTKISVRKAK